MFCNWRCPVGIDHAVNVLLVVLFKKGRLSFKISLFLFLMVLGFAGLKLKPADKVLDEEKFLFIV
jgi:hypothetical protein